MEEAIVVTGIGLISSIGNSTREFVSNLKKGVNGSRAITRFDVSDPFYVSQSGATVSIPEEELEKLDPSKIYTIALLSAEEAIARAKLQAASYHPYRIGVSVGTSHGGNHALIKFLKQQMELVNEEPDYNLLLSTSPSIAGMLSARLRFHGPVYTVSTACSSGTTSVGYAIELLRNDDVDAMIAGGADLFSELTFSGFNCLKALSPNGCKPLTENRTGLMLGEGAAMFVLERKSSAVRRGAAILAELPGYAISNEAYHETAPDPSGRNAYNVMKTALEDAKISVNDIDYINMHGTGTQANDPMELKAVKELFADRLPEIKVSSTKSMIGHALGAAGSLELAATILCMNQNVLPPTINFDQPISGFEDICVIPNQSIEKEIKYALSNSFAFAGHLASIVIKNPKN